MLERTVVEMDSKKKVDQLVALANQVRSVMLQRQTGTIRVSEQMKCLESHNQDDFVSMCKLSTPLIYLRDKNRLVDGAGENSAPVDFNQRTFRPRKNLQVFAQPECVSSDAVDPKVADCFVAVVSLLL